MKGLLFKTMLLIGRSNGNGGVEEPCDLHDVAYIQYTSKVMLPIDNV
jgi:hypothetical protein